MIYIYFTTEYTYLLADQIKLSTSRCFQTFLEFLQSIIFWTVYEKINTYLFQ